MIFDSYCPPIPALPRSSRSPSRAAIPDPERRRQTGSGQVQGGRGEEAPHPGAAGLRAGLRNGHFLRRRKLKKKKKKKRNGNFWLFV